MSNTYFDIVNISMNTKLVQYRHTCRIVRYWRYIFLMITSSILATSAMLNRYRVYNIDIADISLTLTSLTFVDIAMHTILN